MMSALASGRAASATLSASKTPVPGGTKPCSVEAEGEWSEEVEVEVEAEVEVEGRWA